MFNCGLWLSVEKKYSSGILTSDIQRSRSCAVESVSTNWTNCRVTAMWVEPLVTLNPWGAGSLCAPRRCGVIHEYLNLSGKNLLSKITHTRAGLTNILPDDPRSRFTKHLRIILRSFYDNVRTYDNLRIILGQRRFIKYLRTVPLGSPLPFILFITIPPCPSRTGEGMAVKEEEWRESAFGVEVRRLDVLSVTNQC